MKEASRQLIRIARRDCWEVAAACIAQSEELRIEIIRNRVVVGFSDAEHLSNCGAAARITLAVPAGWVDPRSVNMVGLGARLKAPLPSIVLDLELLRALHVAPCGVSIFEVQSLVLSDYQGEGIREASELVLESFVDPLDAIALGSIRRIASPGGCVSTHASRVDERKAAARMIATAATARLKDPGRCAVLPACLSTGPTMRVTDFREGQELVKNGAAEYSRKVACG